MHRGRHRFYRRFLRVAAGWMAGPPMVSTVQGVLRFEELTASDPLADGAVDGADLLLRLPEWRQFPTLDPKRLTIRTTSANILVRGDTGTAFVV